MEVFLCQGKFYPGDVVATYADVLNDEQIYANRFLQRIEYSNGNKGVLMTTPVRFGSMVSSLSAVAIPTAFWKGWACARKRAKT
jgi:hypothetical protein